MPAKKEIRPDYWSAYKAINRGRLSKKKQFLDAQSGKTLEYTFTAAEQYKKDPFLGLISMMFVLTPVILIMIFTILFGFISPKVFLLGIFLVIGYHFTAMYYCVRGPLTHYAEVKAEKKSLFGKKKTVKK